jgi:hypothetical protein
MLRGGWQPEMGCGLWKEREGGCASVVGKGWSGMKAFQVAVCVSVLLAMSSAAFADDLFPPDWRGAAGSTFQEWQFSTNANPAPPSIDGNPYGDPLAQITGQYPYTRWKSTDQGHQGVWTFEDFMILDLPNNPVPNDTKLIWIQITYYAANGTDPELFADPMETTVETINKQQIDAYYWHGTYQLTLHPNPAHEFVYIAPRDCTVFVDQVVVDTICIPEPATLALLGLPLFVLLRRR